jgi:hypothetical protein
MKPAFLFLLLSASFICNAQRIKITRYDAGCRIFEIEGVGNNPLAIAPFLKNPSEYQKFIDTVQYNGLFGSPGIQITRDYYLNVEWHKSSSQSRFWKKHTLQTGFFVTNELTKDNMGLENEKYVVSPGDTAFYQDQYFIVQKQQFLGANIGLNRRMKISNRIQFLTGLNLQGDFAFVHKYHQLWDSSVFRNHIWTGKVTVLPNLDGKNFSQWQATIPLGFEMDVYNKMVFLRAEFDLGIVQDRYRGVPSKKEANGFGFLVVYQPKVF